MYKIKAFAVFVILICSCLLFSSCERKRTPNSYELPKNYVGWVTVKFEKPNAPALEKINGYYNIKISPEGIAETSSQVKEGIAEDEYFWMDSGNKKILPQYNEENTSMIHGDYYSSLGYQNLVKLDTLPIGVEVTLPDGGTVTKLDDKGGVSFKSGRYLMYHFYESPKPEDIDVYKNSLPPLPREQENW